MRTLSASLLRRLRGSRKFQQWGRLVLSDLTEDNIDVEEKHFTPKELAEAWGVDVETIRNIFREEPGVLKISNGSKTRTTLRIPIEVAERVHRRLAPDVNHLQAA